MRDTQAPRAATADLLARYWGWCLGGVLLVALALRLWGIDFGLPYVVHPDEPYWITHALKALKTGDLNPHEFIYPSFYFYQTLLEYLVYYGAGRLLGAFNSLADLREPIILIGGSGLTTLRVIFMVGRIPSLLMGLGTAALAFDLGRRMFRSVLAGTLAGLWVAVSPALVTGSRYMVPDGPLAFMTTLVLWSAWRMVENGRTRDYVLTAIFVGLAGSMKYNALPFAVAPVLAHFLRPGNRGLRDLRLYALGVIAVAAFIITTPYAVLDWPTFKNGAFVDILHYTGGHAGSTGSSLAWYLEYFWATEGPVLALAAAGGILGSVRRSRGVILIAVSGLAYLLLIGGLSYHNERTALPMVPVFALLAAYCSIELLAALSRDGERPRAYISAAAVLIAITLIFPLATAVRDTVRLTSPNSRDTARDWITAELPPGSHIALESYGPWIDPKQFVVQGYFKLNDQTPDWYRKKGWQYLVFSELMFRRFYKDDPTTSHDQIEAYEALFQAFEPVKAFTDGDYEVRIYRVQ
jgi:4-amino-4-deoxy-L-arabinose transferase-like glycosyltransferase